MRSVCRGCGLLFVFFFFLTTKSSGRGRGEPGCPAGAAVALLLWGCRVPSALAARAASCRAEMTQRLIRRGPGISFQLGYSLQMWLRAVTLPPRSLRSDLLNGAGCLSAAAQLGLGASPALPRPKAGWGQSCAPSLAGVAARVPCSRLHLLLCVVSVLP